MDFVMSPSFFAFGLCSAACLVSSKFTVW